MSKAIEALHEQEAVRSVSETTRVVPLVLIGFEKARNSYVSHNTWWVKRVRKYVDLP